MKTASAQTERALADATSAANRAEEANKIASQTLIASERPYVFHHQAFGPSVNEAAPWRERNKTLGLTITPLWSNLGNGPTSNLRIYVAGPHPITPPFEDAAKYDFSAPKDTAFTPLVLGPRGDQVHGGPVPISLDQINDIRLLKRTYYFFGWAEYNDGFPETPIRRTRFCEIITYADINVRHPNVPPQVATIFCPVRYQCVDEQCDKN